MSHRVLRRSYHASPPLERAIIGLGTNLGNRVSNIRAALTSITNFSKLHATSFLYETAPMYLQSQPSYLNAAIEIETHLSPLALLRALKSSETALGRTASPVRNAARVIDLDILTYGTHNVCDVKNHLTIPHPRISERAFALRPIVDLNPDAFVTDKGETAATCLERLPHSADGDVVRVFPVRDRVVKWDGVKLMGILNVTPDSFSDGGNFVRDHDLLHQANKFLNNQFHFLDIGGYSTRPGATFVHESEELRRVIPRIEMLHAEFPHAALSVDTFRPRVAREALRAGASIVNDVTGCRRLEMRKLIYTQEAGVMVMHSRRADAGDAQMYGEDDVGIETELRDRVRDVLNMGVPKWDVIADCGIGFGKNVSQCLRLIGKLQGGVLAKGMDDVPMALGISRKSFLNRVASSTDEKDWATAGVLGNVISRGGVDVVRVHNENMAFVVRAAEMLKGKYV